MSLSEEPCPGCGDGDKVPASGYWCCPVCDAEWHDDAAREQGRTPPAEEGEAQEAARRSGEKLGDWITGQIAEAARAPVQLALGLTPRSRKVFEILTDVIERARASDAGLDLTADVQAILGAVQPAVDGDRRERVGLLIQEVIDCATDDTWPETEDEIRTWATNRLLALADDPAPRQVEVLRPLMEACDAAEPPRGETPEWHAWGAARHELEKAAVAFVRGALSAPQPVQARGGEHSKDALAAVGEWIGFSASVIKSGERWTSTCEDMFQKARQGLNILAEPIEQALAALPVQEVGE